MKKVLLLLLLLVSTTGMKSENNKTFTSTRYYTIKGITFKMIFVQGGTYTMGATQEQIPYAEKDEHPAHRAIVNNFYIGETEVSQALWTAVMGKNPSKFKGDNWPVEYVSYNDCIKFIKVLNKLTGENFRLPTEIEWEYAARGGKKSKGYIYSGSNNPTEVAWLWPDGIEDMHNQLKAKQPNELGIYDMSGSVWEWCDSPYNEYIDAHHNFFTRLARKRFRVIRGGAYNGSQIYSRVSNRNLFVVWRHDDTLGFRLAI